MQSLSLFKENITPWFVGVGVRYWTKCNSTHGPSRACLASHWSVPVSLRVSGVGWERLLVALEIVTESVGASCTKDCFLVSLVHKSIN